MRQLCLALLLAGLVGCEQFYYVSPYGYTGDCAEEMDEVRTSLGPAEEINTYSSSGYYSHDWWYWSRGVEYTFTWGSYVTGCEVSRYTFSPIP
jgi:hypothetical protein